MISEQRLAAIAVDVGRQRVGGRVGQRACATARTSASRTAVWMGRPPRAHATQTAPPRSGSHRNATSDAARPAKLLAAADGAGVEHRAEAQPRQQADLEHPQPLRAGAVAVEQPQERRQPVENRRSRPGGARTACRPARRRRRHAPCARRRTRAPRGSRSRRSAPASPARRRGARAAPPTRARTAPARRRSGAGSCARRAPARTAGPCRARTASRCDPPRRSSRRAARSPA